MYAALWLRYTYQETPGLSEPVASRSYTQPSRGHSAHNMNFEDFDHETRFREAWQSVTIARSVPYTLFTFGESVLPYLLVCPVSQAEAPVAVTRGEVRITRPMLITPDNARPEFQNFFETDDEQEVVSFLLARTAHFPNLKFDNKSGGRRVISETVEGAVAKLSQQLDEREEDRVAILTAPANLGRVAVLRYATEQVMRSAPENLQELRERGFLP
jgi:hypothetical protein